MRLSGKAQIREPATEMIGLRLLPVGRADCGNQIRMAAAHAVCGMSAWPLPAAVIVAWRMREL
jgi:hypothetical protein